MKNNVPPIIAFPQDGRQYKLVWIGTFDLNPHVRSHPIVRIWLTPLRKNLRGKIDFANPRLFDRAASVSVEVGIGMLPYLKIGSIWRDGVCIASPLYETKVISNVRASSELTPAIYASARFIEEGADGTPTPRFYIPFREYSFFDDGLRARMLLINSVTGPPGSPTRLIVPCAEIARFYFFNSTPMTAALLSGEDIRSHDKGLFNPDPLLTFYDEESGDGYVGLRQRMYDSDAAVIARIALSCYATECALGLYDSVVMNYNNDGHFTLDAYPPFTEATTWRVHGKTIQSGNQTFFLVFSIETCSAPFPFGNLYFTRDNDGRTDGEEDEARPEAFKNGQRKQKNKTDRPRERNPGLRFDDEPSRYDPVTQVDLKSKRFTDLAEKKIEKVEKEECHYQAAVARRRPMLADKDYGMGDGVGRESELTPLHLTVIERHSEATRARRGEPLPADLETFRRVLSKLAAMDNQIMINPIRVSDNGEYPDEADCSYMPIFSAWSYLDRQRKQRRQVMIAEVLSNDSRFYLLEISKRPKRGEHSEQFSTLALHRSDGSPIEVERIMLMLRLCAESGGGWPDAEELVTIKRKRFFHTSRTVEAFAQRFYDYFRRQMPEQSEEQFNREREKPVVETDDNIQPATSNAA